jgi:hypothetical protein
MRAGKTGIQNFTWPLGELRGHIQKQKWSLTLSEKFEAIDDRGLDGIKKNKIAENFSLFGYNPAKNNEKNDPKMTPKIGEPRQNIIKNW